MSGFIDGLANPQLELDDPYSTDSTPILSSEPRIQDFYEVQNAVDVARRRIDQDIEKMEGAIRALKSRRNSLAAISRLPPEILSKIFVCCAATYEFPQLTMDWVKITHVSRHWRAVAIGCPHLWTTLVFARPKWVEEMLRRSKMAPLVIHAHFGYMRGPKSTEAVRLAMNHISRARELNIVYSRKSLEELFSRVPRAAPKLQVLVLFAINDDHHAEPFRDNYSVPPELFSDDASQLRRLELLHCNLDWTSHLLKGLTHLKIHDTAPGTRPSTPIFLDVLEQLPTLTVLNLHEALPHVADGSRPVSYNRKVELRSLTNLDIWDTQSDCSNALRHLSMSSIATLKLYCHSTAVSGADFSNILTFVSGLLEPTAIISSAAKPSILSLQIVDYTSMGLGFRAWPTVVSFQTLSAYLHLPPPIILDFHWSSTVTPGILDKVIGDTCATLPLEQLALLCVSTTYQMTEQTLLRRFGKLAHLKSICAQGLAVRTLLSAMIAEPSTSTSTDVSANISMRNHSSNRRDMPPAVYFPSLLHLAIEDASFDSSSNDEYAELEDLKDCLMERYERKAQVRELTISRCHRLTAEHVDELRETVVDVIWDGVKTGFNDGMYDSDSSDEDNYF